MSDSLHVQWLEAELDEANMKLEVATVLHEEYVRQLAEARAERDNLVTLWALGETHNVDLNNAMDSIYCRIRDTRTGQTEPRPDTDADKTALTKEGVYYEHSRGWWRELAHRRAGVIKQLERQLAEANARIASLNEQIDAYRKAFADQCDAWHCQAEETLRRVRELVDDNVVNDDASKTALRELKKLLRGRHHQ
jgi:chromosome segregation ATPase